MSYKLHITKAAERDLIDAADYIEFTLKNPEAADHLLVVAEERFNSLIPQPEIHPIVDDPILSAWQIRFIVINNYIGFYLIHNDIIYIVSFLYGKRDWHTILKQGISLK